MGVQSGRFIREIEREESKKRVKQNTGKERWWRKTEGRDSREGLIDGL